ncbi:exonuclease domain-containing protein [Sphaerisporangium corydalis]|uniref:Exonuclease domain-containing protein n=1 Tax=Sphaerisporangium corydalis TaxID=1441875 RepID=A0ABV9EBS4_9ACTN|nr:exonuclease domain-containing protein [Sphaerisporangium corydalis]
MANEPVGYAVLDLETTGLRPSWHDRIVEVGIVHLDPSGEPTGEWGTLVNPERDLGPRHIHGIDAADIRHAPRFAEIAGTLTGLLRGRALVAHNLRFDLGFLRHEFALVGAPPLSLDGLGICTMTEATRFLPRAPRNLAGCCAEAGIPLDGHHDALVDARATAGLLRHYLDLSRPASPWHPHLRHAAGARWPAIPDTGTPWVPRGVAAERDDHFLARLVDRLPRAFEPAQADAYLALLDRVLLDHHISAGEADALVELATRLDLCRADVERLHSDYLAALARLAQADGVVTPGERHELELVARLLRMPAQAVADALACTTPAVPLTRYALRPGDLVAFTGDMDGGREAWEERACRAGYVSHPNVTKRVRLLVAADPDTLSGKARKARGYGIPIVTPAAFARLIE